MLNLGVVTPWALAAGLFVSMAAPAPVMAQQAYAYNNPFDTNADLTLTGMWAVDDTPAVANGAPGASGGNSLNYNDGVDYDNGAANLGTARTPTIDLTGKQTASLTFWCRYQTESPTVGTWDQRWIRIYNATNNSQVYSGQFGTNAAAPLNCANVNIWHQHTWANMPAAALNIPIIVEFYFTTQDGAANNYQGWFVDDLQIVAADTAAPLVIDDLAASAPTLSGCVLDWTAPKDDDVSGQVASYDLRYATAPITAANWAQATTINGEPPPGPEGTAHTVTLAGLNPGTQYYFAIKSTDFAGNISPLSNVVTITTLAIPSGGGSATEAAPPPKDRYTACSAGTVAGPFGALGLAGLLAAAASLRGFLRRKR